MKRTILSAVNEGAIHESGVTLLELLVTLTIVMILASVAMPLSRLSAQRTHELELRQDLKRSPGYHDWKVPALALGSDGPRR